MQGNKGQRRELWMWLLSDAARLAKLPGSDKWISFFTNLCLNPSTRKKQERACRGLLRLLIDSAPEKVRRGIDRPLESCCHFFHTAQSVDYLTPLALQVADVVFDCQPQAYAALFKKRSSQDILLWFDHFTHDGPGGFQFGAKALAQYALRKREEVCCTLCRICTCIVSHLESIAEY